MNETLTELILQACVGPSLTPDRLIMEQMLLVAVLHTNVGNEVGKLGVWGCVCVKDGGLHFDLACVRWWMDGRCGGNVGLDGRLIME